MRRSIVVATAVLAALGAATVADGKATVKPKLGAYTGTAKSKNGAGKITLRYTDFAPGTKGSKTVTLASVSFKVECADGSTSDQTATIDAPLKGVKFSVKRTG